MHCEFSPSVADAVSIASGEGCYQQPQMDVVFAEERRAEDEVIWPPPTRV